MSEPTLHHLQVRRSARYALLGAPGPETRQLWFVLHGYRQLAGRFIRRFGPIEAPGRVVVAPEALNRFYVGDSPGRHGPEARVGGTWMTREDREAEIQDYVAYLDQLHGRLSQAAGEGGASAVDTVVLGFSQGAHTAARWAVRGSVRPRALILWGEASPLDMDVVEAGQALSGVRVLSVQGRRDDHVTQGLLDADGARWEAAGIRVERLWHEGGHALDGPLLVRLAQELRTRR